MTAEATATRSILDDLDAGRRRAGIPDADAPGGVLGQDGGADEEGEGDSHPHGGQCTRGRF